MSLSPNLMLPSDERMRADVFVTQLDAALRRRALQDDGPAGLGVRRCRRQYLGVRSGRVLLCLPPGLHGFRVDSAVLPCQQIPLAVLLARRFPEEAALLLGAVCRCDGVEGRSNTAEI